MIVTENLDYVRGDCLWKTSFGAYHRILHKETEVEYTSLFATEITPESLNDLTIEEFPSLSVAAHPLIINPVGIIKGTSGTRLKLVYPATPGVALHNALRGHLEKWCTDPTSLTAKIKICAGIAHAVAYQHSNDVTFGRLCPEIVSLSENFVPSILNMGFSFVKNARPDDENGSNFPYIPPDEAVDKAADVYSLAMIIIRVLVDPVILPGNIEARKAAKLNFRELCSHGHLKNLCPTMRRIVYKSLDLDPARRPTAGEVAYYFCSRVNYMCKRFNVIDVTDFLHRLESVWSLTPDGLIARKYGIYVIPAREFPRDVKGSIVATVELYDLLMDLTDELIGHTIKRLMKSKNVKAHQRPELVNAIMIACRVRYRKIGVYAKLIKEMHMERLADDVLQGVFRYIKVNSSLTTSIPHLVLVAHMLEIGLLNSSAVARCTAKLIGKTREQVNRMAYLVYDFFAPEIDEHKDVRSKVLEICTGTKADFEWDSRFIDFYNDMDRMKEDNWAELRRRRIGKRTDAPWDFVAADDSDRLHEFAESITEKYRHNDIFEPCTMLHSLPRLAMFCAAYGARECCECLWLQWFGHYMDGGYRFFPQFAAANGDADLVKMCIDNGAKMRGVLQTCAMFHQPEIARMIYFSRTAAYGDEDFSGTTAIVCAAEVSNIRSLYDITRSGVDANKAKIFNFTALHAAARTGQCQTMEYLLSTKRTTSNVTDVWGNTPLHVAVDGNQPRVVSLLLKRKDVDVKAKNDKGFTPFHLAVLLSRTKILKLFIDARSTDDIHANNGRYPMHTAVKHGGITIVRLLVSCHCISRSKHNRDGVTPLELARELGEADIVNLLSQ